jgi:L-ascorbate metabolism protein UlaG (beta-lactamase superfamily)
LGELVIQFPIHSPTRQTHQLANSMSALSITWLGHATFLLQVATRKEDLFDPWVTGQSGQPGIGEEAWRARSDPGHARAQRS